MQARCTKCSAAFDFRNMRGAKLSDFRCKCGGTYERMTFDGYVFLETVGHGKPSYRNSRRDVYTLDATTGKFELIETAR